jgi:hypothetical protein
MSMAASGGGRMKERNRRGEERERRRARKERKISTRYTEGER